MSRFVRTYKARKIFLDQLAVGSSKSFAARAAGGTTQNFKKWERDDAEFAQDVEDAIEEGTDFIEDAATDRALKKSDALMGMILKARRPDKYDRGSKLELSGGIDVTGARATLLNKLARLQAEGQLSEEAGKEESELPAPAAEKEESPRLLPAPTDPGVHGRGGKRRAVERGNRRQAAS